MKFLEKYGLVISSMGIWMIASSLFLVGGLYSDDLYNFILRQCPNYFPENDIFQACVSEIKTWMKSGRFTPFSFLQLNYIFHFFSTLQSYKCYILGINLLFLLAFLKYIQSIKIVLNPWILVIFWVTEMQFRLHYHDAYNSLNGMYQLLGIFIFCSTIFYFKYLKSGKLYWLILSGTFILFAAFQSEVGLIAFPVLLASIWFAKINFLNHKKSLLFLFSICFGYLLYIAFLRTNIDANTYIGLRSNLAPKALLVLFLKQIIATLPFTNFCFHFRSLPEMLDVATERWYILVLLGSFFTLLFYSIKNKKLDTIKSKFPTRGILLSIVLLAIPALVILPSVKYQQEVLLGSAYLPVLLQNTGLALLLTLLFEYFYSYFQRKKTYFLVTSLFVLCVINGLNYCLNLVLIQHRTASLSTPAFAQYDFIKKAPLQNMKNNGVVLIDGCMYWQSPWIYSNLINSVNFQHLICLEIKDSSLVNSQQNSGEFYKLKTQVGDSISISLWTLNPTTLQEVTCMNKKTYPNFNYKNKLFF